MSAAIQTEFFREGVTEADIATLRSWLAHSDWQTRKELVDGLGWNERKIRDVAELLGADIVRGQKGFKLFSQLTREDLGIAKKAADAAMSQGKRMILYGFKLKQRLHGML